MYRVYFICSITEIDCPKKTKQEKKSKVVGGIEWKVHICWLMMMMMIVILGLMPWVCVCVLYVYTTVGSVSIAMTDELLAADLIRRILYVQTSACGSIAKLLKVKTIRAVAHYSALIKCACAFDYYILMFMQCTRLSHAGMLFIVSDMSLSKQWIYINMISV